MTCDRRISSAVVRTRRCIPVPLLCAALLGFGALPKPAAADDAPRSVDVVGGGSAAQDIAPALPSLEPAGGWGDAVSVAASGADAQADVLATADSGIQPGEHPVYKLRPVPFSDAAAQEVSLDDLLDLAVQNNLGLAGQHNEIEKGHYSVDNTYYAFDPSMSGGLSYSKSNSGSVGAATSGGVSSSQGYKSSFNYTIPRQFGDSFAVDLGLQRSEISVSGNTIPTTYSSRFGLTYNRPLARGAGKYINGIPRFQASNTLMLSYDRLDDQVRQLKKKVLDAYYQAVAARQAIDVRQSALELALKQLDRDVERYKAGLGIQADVLQSENAVLTQRSGLLSAETAYKNLLDSFTSMVGLPQEYTLKIDSGGALLSLGDKLPDDLWDLVAQNSFDLKSLNSQLANLRLTRQQLQNQLKPDLGLNVSYGRTGEDSALGKAAVGLPDASYQVGLQYNGKPGEHVAKTAIASNTLDLSSLDLQIKDTELTLKTSLRDTERGLEEKAEQIDLAQSNLDVLKQTYDITVERNRAGLATTLDVVKAQEDELNGELALLNARVAYHETYRQIQLLAGLI